MMFSSSNPKPSSSLKTKTAETIEDEARDSKSNIEGILQKNSAAAERFCKTAAEYVMARVPQPNVLVVDDDESIRRFMKRCFENLLGGVIVVEALSTEEAIAIAQKQVVHLILVDLNLPGRPGWELVEEVRRSSLAPLVPVILMSGVIDDDMEAVAQRCGANAYMKKPFALETLKRHVKQLFRLEKTGEFHSITSK